MAPYGRGGPRNESSFPRALELLKFGNNTGRKTIRISCVAAVGTNSESKRYLPREKGNSTLTGERGERKHQWKSPGLECGRVFKPHDRFSRFMGRLIKIFNPNLRIYSHLEDELHLCYRKNIAIKELSFNCFAYYESRIARRRNAAKA
ncbi:hypothetical protein CJ030_MR7G009271 [Morella rubra]|uniref:Uncharacterized protein n=1 Tax=Morella rubra TaxID=262757 RepID=A0A6A1V160_9ROSI|nr:hypothetical protein CJ030_MR7G009265 [Morella rubra]KAB1206042.1 hypothetical protein CJ030_MR7G009271 [Morella rubra]